MNIVCKGFGSYLKLDSNALNKVVINVEYVTRIEITRPFCFNCKHANIWQGSTFLFTRSLHSENAQNNKPVMNKNIINYNQTAAIWDAYEAFYESWF